MLIHKLPAELLEYQKLAKDFAAREIARVSGKHDQSGEFPIELIKSAWEAGLLNMSVPEDCGGLGLSCLEGAVIAEELGFGDSGISGSIEASDVAQRFVIEVGTAEQKQEFLAPLMESPSLAGYAMDTGIRAGRVFFRRDGDDFFLNGKHNAIANGGVAEWYLIKAYEDRRELAASGDGSEQELVGGTYFLVRSGEDGLNFDHRLETLGKRAHVISSARFEEVMVPAGAVLLGTGQAARIYNQSLVKTYPIIAAGLVGVARAAMEHALKYSKERQTFGLPISSFQGISFMLADMAKDIEAARLLVYQAAQLADQGQSCISEAVCAKAFAQDMAMRVTTDAVQVFGGYGFSKEYPVEKLMRDAKVGQLTDGTSESLKVNLGRQMVTSV
ncbi:MAG TPA: acyl-CoA dehydrogenase family protein [Candidatus Obscuribacter sp.]|nr:acyl-CoA dehydrogenase family protein [Candidatus Obscuribacter sp.]